MLDLNYTVKDDSITISKQDLEKLIEHYDKQIEFFWNPKPLANKWDGHSPRDVADRLASFITSNIENYK